VRPAAGWQPGRGAGAGPPTNPVEMGLPDIACFVYRASQRPYRAMFESVWDSRPSLSTGRARWSRSALGLDRRPMATAASPSRAVDRGRAGTTFDQMGNPSPAMRPLRVTPFSSKFDAALRRQGEVHAAGAAGLRPFAARRNAMPVTAMAGLARTRCSPTSPPATSEPCQSAASLLRGKSPDALGYVANPAGHRSSIAPSAIFSPRGICSSQPPRWIRDGSSWRGNQARIQVPTLRNVDKRPIRPS